MQYKYKQLVTNLRNKINWGKIDSISKFYFGFFRFKFDIITKDKADSFCKLLESKEDDEPLMPHEVCNWCIDNKVRYKLKYIPVLRAGLKTNYVLAKEVFRLKRQAISIDINRHNVKLDGREYKGLKIYIFNKSRRKVRSIFVDGKFTLRPVTINKEDGKYSAWLFFKTGSINF